MIVKLARTMMQATRRNRSRSNERNYSFTECGAIPTDMQYKYRGHGEVCVESKENPCSGKFDLHEGAMTTGGKKSRERKRPVKQQRRLITTKGCFKMLTSGRIDSARKTKCIEDELLNNVVKLTRDTDTNNKKEKEAAD